MQTHKKIKSDNKIQQISGHWEGLSDQPRHENLDKIKGFGSFEKEEFAKEKERNQSPFQQYGNY